MVASPAHAGERVIAVIAVIEGHDGAAKTPVAEGARAALQAQGLRVLLRAPFHDARAANGGQDLYGLWAEDEGARRAIALLQAVIADAQDQAERERVDVLLFDRHWMTVMTEVMHRPALCALWVGFPPTFFLQAPPEKTRMARRFSYETPWTSSDAQIARYYQRYLDVAERYAPHVVARFVVEQRRQDLRPIQDRVAAHILALRSAEAPS